MIFPLGKMEFGSHWKFCFLKSVCRVYITNLLTKYIYNLEFSVYIMPLIKLFCLEFYIFEDSPDLGNLPLVNFVSLITSECHSYIFKNAEKYRKKQDAFIKNMYAKKYRKNRKIQGFSQKIWKNFPIIIKQISEKRKKTGKTPTLCQ